MNLHQISFALEPIVDRRNVNLVATEDYSHEVSPLTKLNGKVDMVPCTFRCRKFIDCYAKSQQYGDSIWYRGRVLQTRVVLGDYAYCIHFYGFPKTDDEWADELDVYPVYNLIKGDRVYAFWKNLWLPGTIYGSKRCTNSVKNLKGSHQYHVKFDNGEEDKKIFEIFVLPFDVRFTYTILFPC